MSIPPLGLPYHISDASVAGYPAAQRWLSQLSGCFVDAAAYQSRLAQGDTLVYQVANVETASGDGQLHYGLGQLMPGLVGDEYYLTRGHIHTWREAAEVYICLRGSGVMLLEDIQTDACHAVALTPEQVVYVPGHTAHRTVNVGEEPLVYWGVLSSQAGHDYAYVQAHNFQQVVVCREGRPVVMHRTDYLQEAKR